MIVCHPFVEQTASAQDTCIHVVIYGFPQIKEEEKRSVLFHQQLYWKGESILPDVFFLIQLKVIVILWSCLAWGDLISWLENESTHIFNVLKHTLWKGSYIASGLARDGTSETDHFMMLDFFFLCYLLFLNKSLKNIDLRKKYLTCPPSNSWDVGKCTFPTVAHSVGCTFL